MTLRDLSKRQLYNLRRRCLKEQREHLRQLERQGRCYNNDEAWTAAYNKGLKAGLEFAK